MRRSAPRIGAAVGLTLLLALSGCDDDEAPAPATVTVDDLGAGGYTVSVGTPDAPRFGRYYAAADGSRLVVLTDDQDHAERLYRRAAGAEWVAVPPALQGEQLSLLRSDAVPGDAGTPAIATLAGRYVVQGASAGAAGFSVDTEGRITASPGAACRLSGQLTAGVLPRTLSLRLTTAGCAALPASVAGVAVFDSDDAPASFRLVGDDASTLLDLWAFRD